MNFEKIKETASNRLIKIIFFIFVSVVVLLYLKYFFTKGVYFDDTFLKKEALPNEIHYIGNSSEGKIQIVVQGNGKLHEESKSHVIFYLPNNIEKIYDVYFSRKEQWHLGYVEIIGENSEVIFEGRYQTGSMFLMDKSNKPVIGNIKISYGGSNETIYNKDYKVPLINIVEFALEKDGYARGNIDMLLISLLLIAIIAIDIKNPLFFFELKYSFSVQNPKPTELYITMQRIGWVIFIVIALTLLVVAVV